MLLLKENPNKTIKNLQKAIKNEAKKALIEQETAFDNAVFEWTAPEYIQYEKGPFWYAISGLFTAGLTTYGLFTEAWTFSLAVIVLAAVYLYFHKKEARLVKVIISPVGIKFGNKKLPYSHIKAFWVHYQPPFIETLNFRSTNRLDHDVTIPLMGLDPAPIRKYLSSQIHEWEGKQETLTEILIRSLKL